MPRYLILVVIGPLILFGLLLLVFVEPDGPAPPEHVTIGLILGTMFAQTTLAAAWTALGPLPLAWRLPLSLAWLAAVTISFALNLGSHGGPDDFLVLLAVLLAAQWVVVQVPLWVLAFAYGLFLHHVTESNVPTARDRQFGIRQVMILTAIVAVVLGVGRVLVVNLADRIDSDTFISSDALIFVYLTVAGIVLTLPLLLATLIPRYALLATPMVLVLIALGTYWQLPVMIRAGAGGGGGPDIWHVISINAFTAGWIVVVMGLLRLGGYGVSRPGSGDATLP